ncbi:MAG: hypothetical protein APF76_11875 [Desulfitibacter sp. BRH_c19]|nr:MAG: hypothetical protein APF76_11875 [Desulfitibacter sp. BRH_c19]
MNNSLLRYQLFEVGQENIVSDMVWEVFSEFEAPYYSAEGVNTFKEFIHPQRLVSQIISNDFKIYCCFEGNDLVGVLAFRNTSHISLLFVKKSHQRIGIAKELLRIATMELLKIDPDLQELTVNSSPYAVIIYEKLGFNATNTMQEKHGLKYKPMKKCLR